MIEVEGFVLKANLLVFCLMGFDVILGMDWLFRHYAKIDYHRIEVVFEPPTTDRIFYVGDH